MKMTKCDLCGKTIKNGLNEMKISIVKGRFGGLLDPFSKTDSTFEDTLYYHLDICPDCKKKVVDYLNSKNKSMDNVGLSEMEDNEE